MAPRFLVAAALVAAAARASRLSESLVPQADTAANADDLVSELLRALEGAVEALDSLAPVVDRKELADLITAKIAPGDPVKPSGPSGGGADGRSAAARSARWGDNGEIFEFVGRLRGEYLQSALRQDAEYEEHEEQEEAGEPSVGEDAVGDFFRMLDHDGDGKVVLEDIVRMLSSELVGADGDEDAIASMDATMRVGLEGVFAEADEDGDGRLNRAEATRFLQLLEAATGVQFAVGEQAAGDAAAVVTEAEDEDHEEAEDEDANEADVGVDDATGDDRNHGDDEEDDDDEPNVLSASLFNIGLDTREH